MHTNYKSAPSTHRIPTDYTTPIDDETMSDPTRASAWSSSPLGDPGAHYWDSSPDETEVFHHHYPSDHPADGDAATAGKNTRNLGPAMAAAVLATVTVGAAVAFVLLDGSAQPGSAVVAPAATKSTASSAVTTQPATVVAAPSNAAVPNPAPVVVAPAPADSGSRVAANPAAVAAPFEPPAATNVVTDPNMGGSNAIPGGSPVVNYPVPADANPAPAVIPTAPGAGPAILPGLTINFPQAPTPWTQTLPPKQFKPPKTPCLAFPPFTTCK